MSLNLLINMGPLKKGGGQNVALNFLNAFEYAVIPNTFVHFFVAKGSDIHKYLEKINYKRFHLVPSNPLIRILFELTYGVYLIKKLKIDVIYSYFGFALLPSKIIQVVGSVDSNLYYPEINFWEGSRGLYLIAKKLIDKYRILGLRRATAIIFENKSLEDRFHILYDRNKPTTTILPSITFRYQAEPYSLPDNVKYADCYKGLFLSGWHRNKNLLLIPEIAFKLKEIGIPFHFVLTAPKDGSFLHDSFNRLCDELNVSDMVSIVGPVKKDMLESLYNQIDIVFLLSKLESFSNNIIEAYYFGKPLIVSDEPWAHQVCGNAGIYVDRMVPGKIAIKIKRLIEEPWFYKSKVEEGKNELTKYPTTLERFRQEFNFINYIYEKCS